MTHAVVFRPQAEAELLEARTWYEARRRGLGAEFGQAIEEVITRIAARPLSFQVAHGETRRAVLRRFPYAVYFRVTSTDIVVLAVHGRQDPSRWQSRL